MAEPTLVVKVGSTSVATADGAPDAAALASICDQVAAVRASGERVVVVTSGAVAVGLGELGLVRRGAAMAVLQAASAVGQHRVVRAWQDGLARHGLLAGQVLLDPTDFFSRRQYLLSGATLAALLDLGVVPVVNENDTVCDQEIRFGDNDRLAALVAVLVHAHRLVMLTDTAGLHTEDPRRTAHATLIEEVTEIDRALERMAQGPSSEHGSGGMATKLAAARLATWSGIETVIGDAGAADILRRIAAGEPGVATVVRARPRPLAARKAWIAFATPSRGRIEIDEGAQAALHRGASLLAAGVVSHDGAFGAGDAVEVAVGAAMVAKGLARRTSDELSAALAGSAARDVVVVHRDDLVVFD